MSHPTKKVSIFIPSLNCGGAERSMLKLAGGIAGRGYPVDLALSSEEGPFLAEVPTSVRIVNLNARRVLASLPALIRYLRIERPFALLSALHANIVALWAKRLAGVSTRIIVTERNTLSIETHQVNTDLRLRLMPQLVRRFYPWADGIVAVSKGVADDLIQVSGISPEWIRVIYNPIVTPELMEKAQEPLEHRWFGPGLPPVILAVGRLALQKDFSTLIHAFAQVRQNCPARLLILGEGEGRLALEALVSQLGVERDVNLPGFVANPYPYMARAAVFVLSSRWEGLPGVLIEALYCGAPLVSTDCPSGPREILANGHYGVLVPVGDVGAMAQAIVATINVGKKPIPQESWYPYTLEVAVNQYLSAMMSS